MGKNGSSDNSVRERNSIALNAFSRVLAVLFLMLIIGAGGGYLDKRLGTEYWTLTGFIVGGIIAMIGMFYVVRASEFDRKEMKRNSESKNED